LISKVDFPPCVPNEISQRADQISGVHVGQVTIGEDGEDVRKGVTVILPRHPDDIYIPSYAGMHTLNGNGEVSGSYQIADWGFINTVCHPIHHASSPANNPSPLHSPIHAALELRSILYGNGS